MITNLLGFQYTYKIIAHILVEDGV